MILAFGIFASALVSTGFLATRLNKAPMGFEDENGFHVVEGRAAIPARSSVRLTLAALERWPHTIAAATARLSVPRTRLQ